MDSIGMLLTNRNAANHRNQARFFSERLMHRPRQLSAQIPGQLLDVGDSLLSQGAIPDEKRPGRN